MQIGAENRTKVIAAAILGLLALGSAAHTFLFSGSSSSPASVPAANAPPSVSQLTRPMARPATRGSKAGVNTSPSLDPRLRLDLLAGSEGTNYSGAGRNIFLAQAEPEIAKVITPPVPQPPVNQGPPPPPPITLKFFGFASRPGEPKRIFLSQGEDVFIAGEGDIVNRRYKVIHINPNAVEVEDMLYNNRQSLPLVQG